MTSADEQHSTASHRHLIISYVNYRRHPPPPRHLFNHNLINMLKDSKVYSNKFFRLLHMSVCVCLLLISDT